MKWMYRLQQRIGITRQESLFILSLSFVLLFGLAVRYLYAQTPPPGFYAETDRRFEESARRFRQATPVAGDSTRARRPAPAVDERPVRMNLNFATASQLERLPRIGPKMAARILAYREAHGPFKRVADLVRVRGIGEKTLALLEPLLFVDDRP
ncbi:ComEA family DNA-binding protein [Rhodocaloribacter sp.]